MAEQSRQAKEYTRSSHPTQEVTEVKLKSLVFFTVKQANAHAVLQWFFE